MVAIYTGLGSGLVRSSASSLGGLGLLGSGALGRGGEGVSVNAANGNLLVSQQDEFLSGRGLDVAVGRTYNSQAQTSDRDNGDNWQMGTTRRVLGLTGTLNASGSTVQRLSGDGSLVTYTYETRGGVAAYWTTAGDGAHEKLTKSGSNWVWTDGGSQVTETYGASAVTSGEWRMTSQTDTSGQSLSYYYVSGDDRLEQITTANGEYLIYHWVGNNLTQISTHLTGGASLARTNYAYDGSGRLTTVTVDLSPGDSSVSDGNSYTTSYTYDSSSRLTKVLQKDGSQVDVAYDTSGRVSSITQQVASSNTRVTSLDYQTGYTKITAPDGQETRLDYDASGQLTKLTAPPASSGATVQIVQYAYDGAGNLTTVTDPAGKVTAYTYDDMGNATLVTDPNSNTVIRWYDAGNRITAERIYGSSASASSVAEYTQYAYDSAGRLRYTVSAEGRVTEYRYDSYGQLLYQIDYPEHPFTTAYVEGTALAESTMNTWRNAIADRESTRVTQFVNDARGNAYYTIAYDYAETDGSPRIFELFTRTWYTYDQAGRLIGRHGEGETSETFVYDGMGRLVSSVDLNGGTTSIVFNDASLQTVITTAGGYTTTQTYDKAGGLVSSTGSGAWDVTATPTYQYDKLGRVRIAKDNSGYPTYHVYDKAGRKTGEVNVYGFLVEFQYDSANRVIAEIHYGNSVSSANLSLLADPDNSRTIANLRPDAHVFDIYSWTVYDGAGRVVQSIDGTGGVVGYEYDRADHLVRTTAYATKVSVSALQATPPTALVTVSTATADTVTRTFYDKDGSLIGSLDGEGYLVEHVYDKAGQKVEDVAYATKPSVSWTTSTFDQLRTSAGSTARRAHYVYDGRLLRYTVDAIGRVTGYTYDATGKLTTTKAYAAAVSLSDFTFDAVRAAVTSGTNDRTTTQTYDSGGRLSTSTDATGLVTTFGYDTSGNIIKVQAGTGTGAQITRSWYSAGNVLRFSVDAEGYLRRYDYDAAGRKTIERRWDTPISASDSTTISSVNSLAIGTYSQTQFAYYATGQLYTVTDGEGNVTLYQYYSTGQVMNAFSATYTPDADVTTYSYDGAGRLVSQRDHYTLAGETTVSTTYDGLGNRTSATDARGQVTSYTYDEVGQVKTVTDAAGGVTTYTYNAFGEVTQVTDPRGAATVTAYDALGRVSTVTDALTNVTTYTYTAFGEVASVTHVGATTSFEYDRLSRVTKSTDALGFYEQYTYDAWGNRITSLSKLGLVTNYAYDRRGLLTWDRPETVVYDSSGTAVASNIRNDYFYDARGNMITKILANNTAAPQRTDYTYDKADRLLSTSGPSFFGMTPVTSMLYDGRGNVTRSVDPAGARTIYYYDKVNRVAVEISPVGTYTAYTYDLNGNVTSTRVYATAVAVPTDGGDKSEAPAVPSGDYRETTFVYDVLDRLTSSSIAGVTSGTFVSGTWTADSSAIVSTYQYDADGNVVKATDADGDVIWNYYDLLGQKTAQIDGEKYLTTWTYDAEGNVLQEYRFTNKVGTQDGLIPNQTIAVSALVTSSGYNLDDRITSFTYDLNGNRLTEQRYNVKTFDPLTGDHVTGYGTYPIISYLYNGVGQVTRKTEATGDQTNYTYDVSGRLITEQRAGYTDYNGVAVTPTVDYYYDGVGQLTRTRERGLTTADDHVTTYGYWGSKLYWTRDAEVQPGDSDVTNGKLTYYFYDAAGREEYQLFQRWTASGVVTAQAEGIRTAYDAAGRVTQKWQAIFDGAAWNDASPRVATTYNAYGEATGVSVGGVTQTQSQYDAAGRLTATTAGDGVWKYFGYDKAGNQTVAISSAGATLTGSTTFAGALAPVGGNDVNATYTQYDHRNMAATVTEEGRQLTVGGTAQTVATSRSYTAFGEVASETDALGKTTDYTYNTMGRLIKKELPTVSVTLSDGSSTTARPAENYYYDVGGRRVASRDANTNLTRVTLLAGTGYGGSEALVASEIHADGGTRTTKYDTHGDARELADELGHKVLQTFDKMGRIVTRLEQRNAGTTADDHYDYYSYDGLGQQLKHWNNFTGTGATETTAYDYQGRITSQTDAGGYVTSIAYAWNAALATSGLGTFGGWVKTTTMANGKVATEKSDLAGHIIAKTDLGSHTINYTYDVAGRLTSYADAGTSATWSFTWLNSGQRGTVTSSDGGVTNFGYDKVGHIVSETMVLGGVTYKNQTATYDAAGRLTAWADAGGSTIPASSLAIAYDKAGNVRNRVTTYRITVGGTAYGFNDLFTFDSMNRVVRDRDTYYTYDLASNRMSATNVQMYHNVGDWYYQGDYYGHDEYVPLNYVTSYAYDDAGRVTQVSERDQTISFDAYHNASAVTPSSWTTTGTYTYDLLGRVTAQTDTGGSSTTVYNALGQATSGTRTQGGSTTNTTYTYTNSTDGYLLGQLASSTATQGSNTQVTTNSYAWYDGPEKTSTVVTGTGASTAGTSTFTLDAFGRITAMSMTGGATESRSYIYDAASQGIVNTWNLNGTSYVDNWYRMGGTNMWHYSNRFNVANGDQDTGGTTYTVRAGDTLQSVARTIWGDASLWYKLADANGLTASSGLTEGQSLRIPAGVWRNHLNADTYIPYNPASFIGPTDPSPLYASPAGKGNKCGTFGIILLAVVAVAVATLATAGAASLATGASFSSSLSATLGGTLAGVSSTAAGATALGSTGAVLAGTVGAIAGSVVSQGIGVATGIQSKFSWSGVALAGIGSLVGGILGPGGNAFGAAAKAAAGNAITQGIGVATGLQGKFDWAGVAAAGAGGGVGFETKGAGFAASTAAGAIANAATRSAINGESFGDNLIAALPDVLASVVVRAIGGAALKSQRPSEQVTEDPKQSSGDQAEYVDGGLRYATAPTDQYGNIIDDEGPTIVVTARRLQDSAIKKGRGFLDWVDSWTGFNLGGHNPHKASQGGGVLIYQGPSNFFRPSSRSEISQAISTGPTGGLFNASQPSTVRGWVLERRAFDNVSGAFNNAFGSESAFGKYVGTPIDNAFGAAARNTFGPGTALGEFNKAFYSTVDLIDPGVIATMETSGLPIGAAIGEGLSGLQGLSRFRLGAGVAAKGVPSIADDAFVRFDPIAFDGSINAGGIQSRYFSDGKVWLTKYGDIKGITNASDLDTVLYRKNLWPTTQGKFDGGATLRVIDNVNGAVPSGVTNMTNGVRQWHLTSDIAPGDTSVLYRIPGKR